MRTLMQTNWGSAMGMTSEGASPAPLSAGKFYALVCDGDVQAAPIYEFDGDTFIDDEGEPVYPDYDEAILQAGK